jgi:uncharacterized membrane protein
MRKAALAATALSLLLTGAIAGFFYAYSVSVLWGLDAGDPATAIRAMQAINATVRNLAFAPSFFGTPVVAVIAAGLWLAAGRRGPAIFLSGAAIIYVAGAFLPTLWVNVPMNEALARVAAPGETGAAREIWTAYSGLWTGWNHLRTAASIAALALTGLALYSAGRAAATG